MMRRCMLLPAVALLAAGCTPTQWHKPGANAVEQERDLDSCRRQAREQSLHELNARVLSQPYGTGIDARGFPTLAPPLSAEGDRVMIEHGLMHDCMRRLGYDIAPVPRAAR
jgi:hypothetical protein